MNSTSCFRPPFAPLLHIRISTNHDVGGTIIAITLVLIILPIPELDQGITSDSLFLLFSLSFAFPFVPLGLDVLRTGARPTESVRWSSTGLLNTVLPVLYYVAPRATDTCSVGDTVSPIVGS
jgi:hypothetical protein